ncbi:PREDICTED: uncharacterized protein LOC101313508 [Fragaria vesca subsp. vesca]|uniref:uncharacterized protein LOC101313508 n=1 Tax=Fragaria vesca subsp. vesca TaxID=101020 RepID=UPI0002C31F61|nr:PREDICTED: uncharacterized protein LOC101313508 [Fragaria vesca subsp. vesca]
MDVYAVVSVNDGTDNLKQATPTTLFEKGGTNPTFNNYTMRFTLDDSLLLNPLSSLQIRLVCYRPLPLRRLTWCIADFRVPFKELFDDHNGMTFITSCQVWGVYGSPNKGELSFSYKFGDKLLDAPAKKVPPVTSYAVHPGFKAALAKVRQEAEKKKPRMQVEAVFLAAAGLLMYAVCGCYCRCCL